MLKLFQMKIHSHRDPVKIGQRITKYAYLKYSPIILETPHSNIILLKL